MQMMLSNISKNCFPVFRDQADARRMKVKEARLRREERIRNKKKELLQSYREEDKAAKKS